MKTVAEELADKTRAYWLLSSVWNGRLTSSVSTGKALEACVTILNKTNYERPLSNRVLDLRDELIEGSGRTTQSEAKILQFSARA